MLADNLREDRDYELEKKKKLKEQMNWAEKKQQNSNMASWLGTNIKIMIAKRIIFLIFPQTFRSRIAVLKSHFRCRLVTS
jgi:hypothetical protein